MRRSPRIGERRVRRLLEELEAVSAQKDALDKGYRCRRRR
jgi:hypothetical protein